jgi:hypothetical protein
MTRKRIYKKRPRKEGSNWGVLAGKIMQAIEELGPMTRAELCQHLNHDSEGVSSVLARLRKPTKELPQRVHISGWVYDQEGQREYPRAQYALGAEEDKPLRRRMTKREIHSTRQAIYATRLKTASVFNLGLTREQLREQSRQFKEVA